MPDSSCGRRGRPEINSFFLDPTLDTHREAKCREVGKWISSGFWSAMFSSQMFTLQGFLAKKIKTAFEEVHGGPLRSVNLHTDHTDEGGGVGGGGHWHPVGE